MFSKIVDVYLTHIQTIKKTWQKKTTTTDNDAKSPGKPIMVTAVTTTTTTPTDNARTSLLLRLKSRTMIGCYYRTATMRNNKTCKKTPATMRCNNNKSMVNGSILLAKRRV